MALTQHKTFRLPRFLLDNNLNITRNPNGPLSSTTASSYNVDTSFDSNMVIILVALLAALICALGLNSIVRCALRCGHRFRHETGQELVSRLSSAGLKKDQLSQIPEIIYKSPQEISDTECPICLGEFMDGEIVRILPRCKHGFHVVCIDKWLVSHTSCPICRQLLVDECPTSTCAEV